MTLEKFGQTETDEFVDENVKCRQIVSEIMNFGVSQRQIYMIMYLLSLNLENHEHLQELSAILRELREDTHLADHPSTGYPELQKVGV